MFKKSRLGNSSTSFIVTCVLGKISLTLPFVFVYVDCVVVLVVTSNEEQFVGKMLVGFYGEMLSKFSHTICSYFCHT